MTREKLMIVNLPSTVDGKRTLRDQWEWMAVAESGRDRAECSHAHNDRGTAVASCQNFARMAGADRVEGTIFWLRRKRTGNVDLVDVCAHDGLCVDPEAIVP